MFRSFIFAIVLGTAVPASAQIYSWRDADGKLVLSDKPRTDEGAQQIINYEERGAALPATTPQAASSRSEPYEDLIHEHSRQHGVSPDLVRAVIQVESAFNPSAISSKGAMGLMQLMPATAVELGVGNPFEPNQNIRGGVTYLKRLLDRYDQKVELALAAYNAGIGNVEKYGDVPPFKETQNYVKKITSASPPMPVNVIYKWMDLVDGKPVARYSNKPPESGAYQIVGRR